MTGDKYVLDAHDNPVVEEDVMKWAAWMESNAAVALDKLVTGTVSTIFSGLDTGEGLMLWETFVWDGPLDGERKRYASKAEAEAGHREMVERVRKAGN